METQKSQKCAALKCDNSSPPDSLFCVRCIALGRDPLKTTCDNLPPVETPRPTGIQIVTYCDESAAGSVFWTSRASRAFRALQTTS